MVLVFTSDTKIFQGLANLTVDFPPFNSDTFSSKAAFQASVYLDDSDSRKALKDNSWLPMHAQTSQINLSETRDTTSLTNTSLLSDLERPVESAVKLSWNERQPSTILGSAGFGMNSDLLPFSWNNPQISAENKWTEQSEHSYYVVDGRSASGDGEHRNGRLGGGSEMSYGSQRLQAVKSRHTTLQPDPFDRKRSKLTRSKDERVVVEEDTNETEPETQSFLAMAKGIGPPGPRKSSSNPSRNLRWEHTLVVPEAFIEPLVSSEPEFPRKSGGRSGPLNLDGRHRSALMRKIGSCLRCRVSKITVSRCLLVYQPTANYQKCTDGCICKPCQKAMVTLPPGRIKCRWHLSDYTKTFLPGL